MPAYAEAHIMSSLQASRELESYSVQSLSFDSDRHGSLAELSAALQVQLQVEGLPVTRLAPVTVVTVAVIAVLTGLGLLDSDTAEPPGMHTAR